MATYSSISAWRLPWTEEPGGLQSSGCKYASHWLSSMNLWGWGRQAHPMREGGSGVLQSEGKTVITHVNIRSHDVQVAKQKPSAKCLGMNGKQTVNPLHVNLQVVNFQRYECTFTCRITKVSSRVWCTWSLVCILVQCFCVLCRKILFRVQWHSIFISSPGCLEASTKATVGAPSSPVAKTQPSNAEDTSSIPGWGPKILQASWPKNQNIKQKQYFNKFNKEFKNGPH